MPTDAERTVIENKDEFRGPSHLFLLRVWHVDQDPSRFAGKVQHTITGEVHTFGGYSELAEFLCRMIQKGGAGRTGKGNGKTGQGSDAVQMS